MTTLQQRMALSAHANVEPLLSRSEADRNKYGSMAHKLPILIHTAGLAPALAFVESRKDELQRLVLDHLAQTVAWPNTVTGAQLAERSRAAELDEYMLLTRRSLDALLWYKRFVESILKVPPGRDIENGTEVTP